MWNSTIQQLEAMPQVGEDRYEFLRFDYSPLTARWPNDADIHQCLALVLAAASRAYQRGGGDGRVLAVGHSMGGIAIRYAAHDTVDGVPVAEILAGVVTLGTPHLGSPWGGTVLSRALQTTSQSWASGFAREFPPAGSDAQTCLAPLPRRPASCGTTPYLPQGVPLAEIGTQITVERTLFDVGLFRGPTAALYLFGDGVVTADSATGYIGSGPGGPNHQLPYRATVQPHLIDCTYTTDYLTTRWGARLGSRFGPIGTIIGTLGGTLAGEAVDTAAADRLLTGEPSLALAELSYYASRTPCFHTNLAQNPESLSITAHALQEFGVPRTPPPAAALTVTPGAVGPLRLGMSPAEAAATGMVRWNPKHCPADTYGKDSGGWEAVPAYARPTESYRARSVLDIGPNDVAGRGPTTIGGILVETEEPHTEAGIRIGSTLTALLEAHGEVLREVPQPPALESRLFVWEEGDNALVFETWDDAGLERVWSMLVQRAQPQYWSMAGGDWSPGAC